jgi:AcrR family transcriptional regulator
MAKLNKGQRTEEALLNAAREVIAREGYLNTTITEITKTAGRSPGSFYNYFDNKAQLLDALVVQFADKVTSEALRSASADPYESIRGTVRAYWTTFRDHVPEIVGLIQQSMIDERHAAQWRAIRAIGIEGVARRLHVAQAQGFIPGIDPPTMASALVSMLESFCWTWLAGSGDTGVAKPDDETAIATLSTIWYGAIYGAPAPR